MKGSSSSSVVKMLDYRLEELKWQASTAGPLSKALSPQLFSCMETVITVVALDKDVCHMFQM